MRASYHTIQTRHCIVSLRDVVEVIVDCCVTGRVIVHCSLLGTIRFAEAGGSPWWLLSYWGVSERGGGCLARSLGLTIQFDVRALPLDEKTMDGLAF